MTPLQHVDAASGATTLPGLISHGRPPTRKPRSERVCLGCSGGALGGIRTPNLLIRSQMLYPLSYERRVEPEHFSATGHPFRNRF